MSLSLELEFPKCPKCERNFKPMIIEDPKTLISFDYLGCRYCNIRVKTSLLRKQKDIPKFLEQFAKIPEETEISEKEKEKIRLREAEKENLKKYKYDVVPDKCLECNSEDIVADSQNNSWVCLSCDSYFELKNYRIMFHGDIEIIARDHDEAIGKGYEYLRKGYVDIEADWM